MKTRTLKDGRAVTIHRNDGLRKRCDCPRRAWATCPHPWHFSFKWKDTHYRFPIDRYATAPIRTKDDARTEAERLRIAIREGRFPPASAAAPTTAADLTFETFAEKWRTGPRATMPDTLRANDEAICRRFGSLVIDGGRLAEWAIGLITEDAIEGAFGQLGSLAGSTWNKYRDAIRMMQRWGVKKGYLARPWLSEDNEIVVHKQTAKRDRRLVPDVLDELGKLKTPGEERRLLEKAGAWLQRLIIAALETGMRRGELLSLQWTDVSLSRGLLTVRAENAKFRKARQVPISPRVRGVLAMIEHDPAGNPHPPSAFVFGDRIGRQVKDPKKAWLKCCKDAGITGLHFHDLRHEAGSRLLEAGWPLQQVQAMLGHADAKTTGTYLNATVQHLLDSMRRFGTGSSPLHPVAHAADSEPPLSGNTRTERDANSLVN
jgi:integrase